MKCFNGPNAGIACTTDAECNATGSFCGTDCNHLSQHPGVCNSPTHLSTTNSASAAGTALILTTTAIGVIGQPDDNGSCFTASICLPLAFGSTPSTCVVNSDCSAGKTCGTAYCQGICSAASPLVGSPCTGDVSCGGVVGSCVQGPNYGVACTHAGDAVCGANNLCTPQNVAKGYDGVPCTADDPQASQGVPSTIPETTATASAGLVDANNNPGTQEYGSLCSGKTVCLTSTQGVPFNCPALLGAGHSVSHASLASAFPQVEGYQTGDAVVTNKQTAK